MIYDINILFFYMSYDPSEVILKCWFDAQETFLIIIINVENRAFHFFRKFDFFSRSICL